MYLSFCKNIKQHSCFLIIRRHVSWAANQHIRTISEGSCDTEDEWMLKIQLYITEINYILKYIQVENCNFDIKFHILTIFTIYFYQINAALVNITHLKKFCFVF